MGTMTYNEPSSFVLFGRFDQSCNISILLEQPAAEVADRSSPLFDRLLPLEGFFQEISGLLLQSWLFPAISMESCCIQRTSRHCRSKSAIA